MNEILVFPRWKKSSSIYSIFIQSYSTWRRILYYDGINKKRPTISSDGKHCCHVEIISKRIVYIIKKNRWAREFIYKILTMPTQFTSVFDSNLDGDYRFTIIMDELIYLYDQKYLYNINRTTMWEVDEGVNNSIYLRCPVWMVKIDGGRVIEILKWHTHSALQSEK